jgi:transposase InsO family protein
VPAGELVHVGRQEARPDPDGGGWLGRGEQVSNHRSRPDKNTKVGFATCTRWVDDHSRLAYSEVLPDEKGATCAAFLLRAAAEFATRGIDRIEEVITDNHMSYKLSHDFRDAIAALDARHLFIQPFCPWQNGKVERFNRTWPSSGPTDSPSPTTPHEPQPFAPGSSTTTLTDATAHSQDTRRQRLPT